MELSRDIDIGISREKPKIVGPILLTQRWHGF